MMVLRPGQFRQSFRSPTKKQERNDSPIVEEDENENAVPSKTPSEAEGRPDEVR